MRESVSRDGKNSRLVDVELVEAALNDLVELGVCGSLALPCVDHRVEGGDGVGQRRGLLGGETLLECVRYLM
jgi:hypothetical protein